jgi:hypothetical protein
MRGWTKEQDQILIKQYIKNGKLMFSGKCKSCLLIYGRELDKKLSRIIKRKVSFKIRMNKLREAIIRGYGGKCTCPECPKINPAFLTIEHINGGGTAHRKTNSPYGVMKEIVDNNFPPDYTILCYNCNCAKAHRSNNNTCPHLMSKNLIKPEHLEKPESWLW